VLRSEMKRCANRQGLLFITDHIGRRRWVPVGMSENCQVRKSPALSGAREEVYSSIGELPMGRAEIP
jgi:hypothetical protein